MPATPMRVRSFTGWARNGLGVFAAVLVSTAMSLPGSIARADDAGSTPAQISLWTTGAQLPREDRDVTGLSFSPYYGEQSSVSGLDLGIVNGIREDMSGLELGLANSTGGNVVGLQAGLGNRVSGDVSGLQLGGFGAVADGKLTGIQLGAGNGAKSGSGLQVGGYNWISKRLSGAQFGVFGRAEQLVGTQLNAVASVADECDGLQVGPIFTRAKSGACAQFGLLNFNDSGFLKAFPIFNLSTGGGRDDGPAPAAGQGS